MSRVSVYYLFLLFSLVLQAQVLDNEQAQVVDNEIEYLLNRKLSYLEQGIRDYSIDEIKNQYLWPFEPFDRPSPVGHECHSYQNYNGSPYFHHGVDIRVPSGSGIYSSTGGTVVNIENYISGNSLYWEIAIRDEQGFLWQYHHVDRSTIPNAIFDAYKNGTRIPSGTLLGKVVYWPVQAYNMNFHHIHLNVLDGNGNYLNPFLFLLKPLDCIQPNVMSVYFVQNEGNTALGSTVKGDVDIIVRAEDKMDGQPYQLTVYKMEYEIKNAAGESVVPRTLLWQFDRLPGGSDINAHVHTLFKPSFIANGKELSTEGNYSNREFYFVVTNQVNGAIDSKGCWKTTLLSDGNYSVIVYATDFNQNTISKTVNVVVKNH